MATLPLLLIEDDPAIIHILKATLQYGGFESDSATTGLDAIERLREQPYAAILLDLGLPDLGGHNLIKLLRTISDAPILIVTGVSEQQDKILALDSGADDFIEKPFQPGELLARIRAVLRRSGRDGGSEDGAEPKLQRAG